MKNSREDISVIKKYLNGELDARARHRLEKRAQDDPFLMDALEGYGLRAEQANNLDDLHRRLRRRVPAREKKPLVLWPIISVAASVLAFIVIGAWWLMVYLPDTQKAKHHQANVIAQKNPAAPAATPLSTQTIVKGPPAPADPKKADNVESAPISESFAASKVQQAASGNRSAVKLQSANVIPKPDKTVAGKTIVDRSASPYSAAPAAQPVGKKDAVTAMAYTAQKPVTGQAVAAKVFANNPNSEPQSALNEVAITRSMQPTIAANEKPLAAKPAEAVTPSGANTSRELVRITGRIKSLMGNAEVTDVGIYNRTTGEKYQTTGSNYLVDVARGDEIYFTHSGFKTQKLKVNKRTTVNITLEEVNSSLFDGYVRGISRYQFDDTARPVMGWEQFKFYQERKTTGEPGIVKVKLTVNPDNSVSDIKIVKSLNDAADAEIVKLISQIKWQHNLNNEPESITVKFNFKK